MLFGISFSLAIGVPSETIQTACQPSGENHDLQKSYKLPLWQMSAKMAGACQIGRRKDFVRTSAYEKGSYALVRSSGFVRVL